MSSKVRPRSRCNLSASLPTGAFRQRPTVSNLITFPVGISQTLLAAHKTGCRPPASTRGTVS